MEGVDADAQLSETFQGKIAAFPQVGGENRLALGGLTFWLQGGGTQGDETIYLVILTDQAFHHYIRRIKPVELYHDLQHQGIARVDRGRRFAGKL